MAYKASNNGVATLALGINTSETTIQVATGLGDRFPVISGGNHTYITFEKVGGDIEVMKVTARASGSDSMTVVRAQDGTTAKTWLAGDVVECRPCAAVIADLQAEAAAAVSAHEAAADPHPNYALESAVVGLTGDQTIGGIKTFTGLINANANISISGIAPLITLVEADQASPAGRRRIVQDANLFTLRRNTAAAGDFSTEVSDITSDASGNFTANGNITAGGQFIGNGSVPPGAVMHFAMNSAPTGWLRANGAAVSRATFAALFAVIGTTYGAGDGSTTFNLPDLRGEFIRGWDDGRGVDTGRGIGTTQAGQMPLHTHNYQLYGQTFSGSSGGTAPNATPVATPTTAAGGTENASENRPRNIALLACIKF